MRTVEGGERAHGTGVRAMRTLVKGSAASLPNLCKAGRFPRCGVGITIDDERRPRSLRRAHLGPLFRGGSVRGDRHPVDGHSGAAPGARSRADARAVGTSVQRQHHRPPDRGRAVRASRRPHRPQVDAGRMPGGFRSVLAGDGGGHHVRWAACRAPGCRAGSGRSTAQSRGAGRGGGQAREPRGPRHPDHLRAAVRRRAGGAGGGEPALAGYFLHGRGDAPHPGAARRARPAGVAGLPGSASIFACGGTGCRATLPGSCSAAAARLRPSCCGRLRSPPCSAST